MLAVAYAVLVFLIAPTWLSADEVPVAEPEVLAEPAPEVPAPEERPAEPGPVVEAQTAQEETDEPAAETKPPSQPKEGKEKEEDEPPVAMAAADGSVTIKDFDFAPKTITVNVGDTVTWTNQGPSPHTATAEGKFDTGTLNEGESGSHTFTEAGTINYICTPHPFMKGTVVVQGESASSGGGGSGDTGSTDTDTAGATADTGDGPELPDTGGETILLTLLGLATLGSGLLLRRRAEG